MGLHVDLVFPCHSCSAEVWAQSKIARDETGMRRVGDLLVEADHMIADEILLLKDGDCACGARNALELKGGIIVAVAQPDSATCEELPWAGLRRLKRSGS